MGVIREEVIAGSVGRLVSEDIIDVSGALSAQ